MKINLIRESGDPGFKAIAGRYYQEKIELAEKLSALSVAHGTMLAECQRQAAKIVAMTQRIQQLTQLSEGSRDVDVQAEVELDDEVAQTTVS